MNKDIEKIQEKREFFGRSSTAAIAVAEAAASVVHEITPSSERLFEFVAAINKLALPPRKMNFLKSDCDDLTVLNISNS